MASLPSAVSITLLLLLLLLTTTTTPLLPLGVDAAWCKRSPNVTQPPNMNPIDTSAPVFIKHVPNGDLYSVGSEFNDRILLLHVYGNNGYDYGYAQGLLIGSQINETLTTAFHYFRSKIEEVLNKTSNDFNISQSTLDKIAKFGLDFFLDWQNSEDEKFVDPEIYAEMRGISDASGVDYLMIRRLHMFGELTKASCSFYGAWGDATLDGKTLQLRALDWDLGPQLQNHPTVTVYHPLTPSLGVPFANVGWAGWIGVLTGMSSNRIGISEIGISNPDNTFGNESYVGIPFIFLMRQILQFASSYKEAEEMITNATRTCFLVLGVGDGNAATARMVQYSHSVARFFNDTDLEPNYPWHPRMDSVVYLGMDWICPYFSDVLHRQLSYAHGILTPEISIQNVTAVVGTDVAVYDLTDLKLYVANARGKDETSGEEKAFARQFVALDMKKNFGKKFGENFL